MSKTIKFLKLGTVCRDIATGITGTLTHWVYDLGGRTDYLFQPPGLNPETGQPVSRIHLEAERLEVADDDFENVEIMDEILGSQVKDKASQFAGMAVGFVRHINGCFHVIIQPEGVLGKTNSPIHKAEFDLRGCEGPKIPVLTPEEKAASQERDPSPDGSALDGFIPGGSSVLR